MKIGLLSALLFLIPVSLAQAADVNQQMTQDRFSDVEQLMNSMTPQQRATVLKQASLTQQDLKHLTPAQQQQLEQQLRTTADTIRMEDIDPSKIDTSKAKDTATVQKDLTTYQQKYDAGTLRNSAVRPRGDSQ